MQACLPNGTFAACACADAAPPPDLGVDAPDDADVRLAPQDAADDVSVPDVDDAGGNDVSDVVDATTMDAPDIVSAPDVVSAQDIVSAPDVVSPPDIVDAPVLIDSPDVPAHRDAGADVVIPVDQPPPADVPLGAPRHPCAPESIVDLSRVGEREGAATLFVGDNTFTLPGAMEAPSWCANRAGRTVVFRYVARTASRVTVSVEPQTWLPTMTSSERLNPVAWALDRCEEGRASQVCVDDGRLTEDRAVFALPSRLQPGDAVFLAVAGRQETLGRFLLRVVEHAAERAPGSLCDPAMRADVCALGSSCEGQGNAQDESRCVPDGARFGRCRTLGVPCDRDLACDGRPGHVESRCVPSTAPACSLATASRSTCARGSCVLGASGPSCAHDGAWMGRCREGATPCDPGLVCSDAPGSRDARCLNAQPEGATCARNALSACAEGSACVAQVSTVVGQCLRVGATGGRCRVRGAACDPGLACSRSPDHPQAVCVPSAALGDPCRLDGTLPCAPGASCVGTNLSNLRCAREGSAGARCRAAWPRCDEGLGCNAESNDAPRCVPVRAVGQGCDPRNVSDTCAEGTLCLGTGSSAACTAAGGEGQRCRVATSLCAAGLRCVGTTPLCRRPVGANALCGSSADSATCEPGFGCQRFDTESRCTPLGTVGRLCLAHGPPCADGLACSTNGVCAAPAADGEACSGAVPCGAESSCVSGRCRRRGGAGGPCRADVANASLCDAGLVCDGRICQVARPLGALCSDTQRCENLEGCSLPVRGTGDPVCVAAGAPRGPCRDEGAPCEPGLTCDRSVRRCLPTLAAEAACSTTAPPGACDVDATCRGFPTSCTRRGALGAHCRPAPATPCDGGRVCVSGVCATPPSTCSSVSTCGDGEVCAAGRCISGAYRTEVIAGAAPVDACAAGSSHLFAMNHLPDLTVFPLPFPVSSRTGMLTTVRMLPVTLDATLGVVLLDGGGNDVVRLLAGVPLDRVRVEMRCAAVEGVAPRRRLVLQWRGWTAASAGASSYANTPATPLETFDVAVAVGEDGAHEIRYLQLPPPPPLQPVWPPQVVTLTDSGETVLVSALRVSSPTTVRFVRGR